MFNFPVCQKQSIKQENLFFVLKNLLTNQQAMNIRMTYMYIYCLHLSLQIKTMVSQWLQLCYFAEGAAPGAQF